MGRITFQCLTLLLVTASVAHAEKPNIILMMADDMGMGDTSAYQDFTGNADGVQVHTPQMERLANMGVRFTDAHTPSSRCSPTRYGLLTGRYPWRNRLKHWVLFGAQGDPMIEADRPTIASMLKANGYRTAMFGKWHVGLRYTQANGKPAAAWSDADLTKPMHTAPVDHGFDIARFTSRSHGTSGPDAGKRKPPNRKQSKKGKGKKGAPSGNNRGPGHVHNRDIIGATGKGKELVTEGPSAYVLTKLGSRHSDHALAFLKEHVSGDGSKDKPFFLYYPSNSNHGPYTPDVAIGGVKVKGAARTKSGNPMDARHDYIFENDVALGRMMDWLAKTNDPRQPDKKLIETTMVIFTSDNGAEKNSDIASGPFRSHKGSVYEGGHRVPFIVSWPAGGVGDGDARTKGQTNRALIGLVDLYATLAQVVGQELPDLRLGQKGAEDSFGVLDAFRGRTIAERPPMFFNDHKEAKGHRAVAALRIDSPTVDGKVWEGQWKLFFHADLLRMGVAKPYELYELSSDQREKRNLIDDAKLKPLVEHLTHQAVLHRTTGGHRLAPMAGAKRHALSFRAASAAPSKTQAHFQSLTTSNTTLAIAGADLKITIAAMKGEKPMPTARFNLTARGLGVSGASGKVDAGESLVITFNKDVIVESAEIVAGNDGVCGGFYRVGKAAPMAVYCIDADIDSQDQSGVLSDIGVVRAGQQLRLDSSPHLGVETPGKWRLASLAFREIK